MAYNYEYPYVDPNRYNSDWVLTEIKRVIAEWVEVNKEFIIVKDRQTALEKYVKDYFKNLDIADEINNKIDNLIATGEFEIIIGNMFPFANAKNYGAIGDGVTDDTAAIKAMFADTRFSVFYIPKGQYKTSQRIVFPENSTTYAYGAVFTDTDTTHSAFEIRNSNVRVYGLEFDGKANYGRNDTNTSILLIHATNDLGAISNILVKDCYFHHANRYAINIGSAKGEDGYTVTKKCEKVTIDNCVIDRTWVGVKQSHPYNTNITSCRITQQQAECITCDDGTEESVINGCYLAYTHGGIGCIGADDSRCCTVSNCYIRNYNDTASGRGIAFNQHTGTNRYFKIIGNTIESPREGIKAKKETGYEDTPSIETFIISNNNFINCTVAGISIDMIRGRCVINGNTFNMSDSSKYLVISEDEFQNFLLHCKCDIKVIKNLTQSDFAEGFTMRNFEGANQAIIQNGKAYIYLAFTKTGETVNAETVCTLPFPNVQYKWISGFSSQNDVFGVAVNKTPSVKCYGTYAGHNDNRSYYVLGELISVSY